LSKLINMKKVILLIWLALFAIDGNAQHVFTASNINLRSAPSADGKIVYQIPKGTPINLNGCQDVWCEVTISGHSGFVARKYTVPAENFHSTKDTHRAHPTEPINHYTNSRGNVVQSPTHYDGPPAGATAQCRDGSYSFSQSRRGTCSHHGGVARWLQ